MYYHPGFPRNRKSREITLHMKISKLSQNLSFLVFIFLILLSNFLNNRAVF